MGIAHLAFYLGFGRQGSYAIYDYHIYTTASYQGFSNFQSLLASIRLGDK
jgi:hypothetical protein